MTEGVKAVPQVPICELAVQAFHTSLGGSDGSARPVRGRKLNGGYLDRVARALPSQRRCHSRTWRREAPGRRRFPVGHRTRC
jgi:hypothetical protein